MCVGRAILSSFDHGWQRECLCWQRELENKAKARLNALKEPHIVGIWFLKFALQR
jgi:hypothetical protein